MQPDLAKRHFETIVIGGGQAGLALGFYLARYGREFVILNAEPRVGDTWRQRWDSLKLFTPAQHAGLPGLPCPAPRGTYPGKDVVADYLEAYAERFALPVRCGVKVERLARSPAGFELHSTLGRLTCRRVVVATGTNPTPRIPRFAGELDPGIRQLHSREYRRPDGIPPGEVLVVGAGTSGFEIALDLAPGHRTFLAGRATFHVPNPVLHHAGGLYWLVVHRLLTIRTPLGRKLRRRLVRGGAPLLRVSVADLGAAGVKQVPRVAGVRRGFPLLADGRTLRVATVIWATGFAPDFSWINFRATDQTGWLAGKRGVSSLVPGLYFVGLPFQFGLTSGFLGGVGRDAAYVARRLVADAARDEAPRLGRLVEVHGT